MPSQLFGGELRRAFRVFRGVLDGIIHEIVNGVAVVKVCPGAKKGVRPCGSDR
jgi:hypothetical protein